MLGAVLPRALLGIIIFWLLSWVARKVMMSIARNRARPQGQTDSNDYGAAYGAYSRRGKTPYETLQVSPNASIDDIRAAYRRMVQLYHPDKVSELGPELREVAERHMKEINAAYEALKRRHGG